MYLVVEEDKGKFGYKKCIVINHKSYFFYYFLYKYIKVYIFVNVYSH